MDDLRPSPISMSDRRDVLADVVRHNHHMAFVEPVLEAFSAIALTFHLIALELELRHDSENFAET